MQVDNIIINEWMYKGAYIFYQIKLISISLLMLS